MSYQQHTTLNIALIGGGSLCKDVLTKSIHNNYHHEIGGKIVAVTDPDPNAPGCVFAKSLSLKTESDYHNLYKTEYNIHLIILLTPEEETLADILSTKPDHIRLLSYQTFTFLWTAIGLEERKLRSRTQEIETILDGIQDAILVLSPDMTIVEANRSFLAKMGYTRETVIGRKCYEIYHNLDDPCEECEDKEKICPIQDVIRNKQQARQIQIQVDQEDGLRYYDVNIYPIWEKGGKISKFIHISRDVTKRKKEEIEIKQQLEDMVEDRTRRLKETHAKLLHQDKMASLGKLSASVVHEINNPIAGILNLILLMKRIINEGALSEKDIIQFSKYLELMETETKRTSRIISNLLTFSRQSKMELKSIDINELIEKTLFLNANLLQIDGAKIEKQLGVDLPDILGSEDQLLQVFMNVVSNSAEAIETKGGGVLAIETRHIPGDEFVTAIFKDTGIGIPPKNLPKLFEPFFTTKKKGKGVGLGLSVVYGIIEEHGGSIHVTSIEGEGTTSTIKLPLHSSSVTTNQSGGLQ